MKIAIIIFLVIACVAVSSRACFADAVWDINGNYVNEKIASATTSDINTTGLSQPQNIVVTANIKDTVEVRLNGGATWDINKPGVYFTSISHIYSPGPWDKPMQMHVYGCNDMVDKAGTKSVPTYLYLYNSSGQMFEPSRFPYKKASDFNGTYTLGLYKGASVGDIFMKIDTTGVGAGSYQNTFTVTFSRQL